MHNHKRRKSDRINLGHLCLHGTLNAIIGKLIQNCNFVNAIFSYYLNRLRTTSRGIEINSDDNKMITNGSIPRTHNRRYELGPFPYVSTFTVVLPLLSVTKTARQTLRVRMMILKRVRISRLCHIKPSTSWYFPDPVLSIPSLKAADNKHNTSSARGRFLRR